MVRAKSVKKRSGRRYTVVYHPEKYPYEEQYWDEWRDYRDGTRSPVDRSRIRPTKGLAQWFIDNCHIISDNRKLKRKEKIRRQQRNDKKTSIE